MKHELETIKWDMLPIVNYRGCLVEKIIGGFKVLGTIVVTPKQVDDKIESANNSLKNSIK